MKTLFNKSLLHSTSLLLALVAATAVIADDTEVYLGSSATSNRIRPNILFIIDNSGSMRQTVPVTTVTEGSGIDYDPTVDYNADPYFGGCDTSKIYWARSGDAPPTCATDQYIDDSSFTCNAAATALSNTVGSSGFYLNRFARYRDRSGGDEWDTLSSWDHNDWVECEADWGVHGNGGANKYPADQDNGGPWRSDDRRDINWSRTGSTYKVFSANYLAWYNISQGSSTTVDTPKIDVVKSVFSDLVVSMSDVNIGLMRFNTSEGGHVFMPMDKLTHEKTIFDPLTGLTTIIPGNDVDYDAAVQSLVAETWTPLAETLYEGYQYFKGAKEDYGDASGVGTTHPDALTSPGSGVYDSPIDDFCQKNFIILLTDGEPTYDTGADSKIRSQTDFAALTGSSSCTGNCLDEQAEYMYKQDCRDNQPDKQNVITYTIGFAINLPLLQDAANKGGGEYYTANDTAGLTDAFASILTDILAINTSFVAPAVSVNAFNRFTHRDELYYALFRPGDRPNWNGNVKKFKLTKTDIVDANGAPAVDPNTGFFSSDATSFWTDAADAPDGAEVELGGAAGELSLTRNVYTNTGTSTLLSASSNKFHEDNSDITKVMLGDSAMSDTLRADILKWARGVDLNDDDDDNDATDARRSYSDPIHAKPILITYGGTEADPDISLFVGTNGGYLHAINVKDGSEQFAFMPQELLSNLPKLFENSSSEAHPYGLDGPLTYWFNDLNNNGMILTSGGSLEAGEHIYLYQGMRRGGRSYYALDVSDRKNPVLLWTITGGSAEFSELGQTWSSATHAKIRINGNDTDVLIFGGGYDTNQDGNEIAEDDTEGRAIYIVNAKTGAKIWQAGPVGSNNGANPDLILDEMTNSIPADITVLDTDGDGYADRLYAADMRAQLWRIDLNNENTSAAKLAKDANGDDMGGVIAKLGGEKDYENRRFYYAPDVSLSKSGLHYNIAIGSGYRSHPLDQDIHDSFYIVRDGFSMEEIRKRTALGLYITPDGR
ncbi:MAG: PilC/PilY family type IV pilus protein, partial [Gammaproteobacteria bacterium]|nr:PilC/PilY family type IV pilus protein [Gammaproteobacteria bacterium]